MVRGCTWGPHAIISLACGGIFPTPFPMRQLRPPHLRRQNLLKETKQYVLGEGNVFLENQDKMGQGH